MGFVPGFDSYKQVTLPEAAVWYESREIYANVKINDLLHLEPKALISCTASSGR